MIKSCINFLFPSHTIQWGGFMRRKVVLACTLFAVLFVAAWRYHHVHVDEYYVENNDRGAVIQLKSTTPLQLEDAVIPFKPRQYIRKRAM
jgi:hypothetical protein